MRIAHVSDCYLPRLGGIEMQVHDLATRQRAAGHETTVITQTPGHGGEAPQIPDPPWVTRVPSPISQPMVRPFVAGLSGASLLTRDRFDLVHVHASLISPFSMLSARAASRAGVPTLVTVHSLWARTGPAPDIAWGIVGHIGWPVVWSAVSETAAGQVARTLGAGSAVAVLPNGIDAEAWRTVPAPRPPNTVTIASVMRLTRRKRPMPLLKMLRRLRDRVSPNIQLRAVIIGDGPLRDAMASYLRAHDMESWVTMPGRLERPAIKQVFRHSDLYVAPARLESFGIAALEARTAGLPVIATRNGGVGEFITDGSEGFLTGSDNEMVHALTALAHDHHTRGRIAAHNHAVLPTVSWPSVLERAEVLYAAAEERAASEARRRATRAGSRRGRVSVGGGSR
jgi:glycosyltransferase involved in cell wall biosynthesis